MHKMLFDKKRRSEGTSAVLIQSLPGGGKSSMARQYVYAHRDDYPGGIFWLSAKSQAELAAGFWDVARKAVLKDMVDKEDAISLADPQHYIKLVRKWFNHRHDWLLILDGIHFEDTDTLQKFIPDSSNTGLIYTSTDKAVTGDHHFMNPQIIKLPRLAAREAQRLLLLELDKKEPFLQSDLEHAMQLVVAIEYLPVVIHAVAQDLKSSGASLSRFAKTYASAPQLGGLGTYKRVTEELERLNAQEALNLIRILCFFSQHIPVEMISLGLKELDVPIKAIEPITGRSLNNTFRYLNKFALVERNEPEPMHSSQSSRDSREMLSENVDAVRLHSVVQGFFIETLNGNETLPLWLDRAVSVFCHSYKSATIRISSKTHAGLVEDYRLYEIHGKRLQQHLKKFIEKYPTLRTGQELLEHYLQDIKAEIERRTPASSQTITEGKPDAFQTSIFDRTSSSSDTGPETPKSLDRHHEGMTPWGLELGQGQIESPSSLTHDSDIHHMEVKYAERVHRSRFPLSIEDPGYDSDRESTAMTLQPSQRTAHQVSPISPNGEWEVVKPKRTKKPERLDMHRTVKRREKNRYSDQAGSFRAVSAIDPRVSHETAQGYLQRTSSRAHSRGRISGQSHAEVALTHIAHTSPPPPRGGGMIQDKRSSSQRATEGGRASNSAALDGRMMTGAATYASAVTKPTTVLGFRDARPISQEISALARPPSSTDSSAMASLQQYPVPVLRHPPTPANIIPMPPYPRSPGPSPEHSPERSPGLSYQQPLHLSDGALYSMHGRQENISQSLSALPTTIYPRMTGQIPIESNNHSTSPLKRDLPHDYTGWYSQTYPEGALEQHPPFLSLSSPNIQRPHSNSSPHASPYYPGRPELSFSSEPNPDGYTSQPMSRDPSGQSAQSHHSTGVLERGQERGRGRRRVSIAETEPPPQLPSYSPRIRPTSYQVYTKRLEQEFSERQRSPGYPVRKSPRLGYANTADDRSPIEENHLPSPRRQFNPSITSFSPSLPHSPSMLSQHTHSISPLQHHSPFLPPSQHAHSAPPSHHPSSHPSPLVQAQSTLRSFSTNPIQYPPPSPGQIYPPSTSNARQPPEAKSNTSPILQQPFEPPLTQIPRTFSSLEEFDMPTPHIPQGEAMGRSGSGGVNIGNGHMIGFGDIPDKVDIRAARERVRVWGERKRARLPQDSSGLEEMLRGRDVIGLGIQRS